MQGEQAADPQDREALNGQQDQQHGPGDRRQPLVALGPAEPRSTLSRLGLPGAPGSGWGGRWRAPRESGQFPLSPYWSGYDTLGRYPAMLRARSDQFFNFL